jgi:hypothetical protein
MLNALEPLGRCACASTARASTRSKAKVVMRLITIMVLSPLQWR